MACASEKTLALWIAADGFEFAQELVILFGKNAFEKSVGKTAATIYITTLAIRALESTEHGVAFKVLEDFTGGFRDTIRSILYALEASREYWLFRIHDGRDRFYRVERADANDGDARKQGRK